LRQAATVIAQEVLRAPDPESLTQASVPNIASEITVGQGEPETGSGESPFAAASNVAVSETQSKKTQQQVAASETSPPDPVLDAFLSTGRSKLDEIDSLLKGEDEK
jgi:chemotaxis protein MotC